jgi:hypothetical protein
MVEVVRGRAEHGWAEEVLRFWSNRRALSPEEAERRLPEVVCVLRDGASVLGVSSAYAAEVPPIGHRRFWIYRSLLDPAGRAAADEMILSTFEALEAEFDRRPGSPLGLCLLIADPDERRRRPEAQWDDPPMAYAGYLADGRQVRIGYFQGAVIHRDA